MPLVSQWTLGESLQPTEALRENARQQLRELIAQDFNHPSVITWSIANEVDFGNSMPAFVGFNLHAHTLAKAQLEALYQR